ARSLYYLSGAHEIPDWRPKPIPLPLRSAWQAAVPDLIAALSDEDAEVRDLSARTLGQLGPEAEAALPALATVAASDRDEGGRRMAERGRRSIASIEALEDPRAEVRLQAAWTLGRCGWAAARAVPALVETLKDEDLHVRVEAATSLGLIGSDARAALPALREVERADGEESVRDAAAGALKAIGAAEDESP